MLHVRCKTITGLGLLIAVLLFSSTQAEPYENCGVLVQAGECTLFVQDPGVPEQEAMYELDSAGSFIQGDFVMVNGDLDTNCTPNCPDVDGCITVTSIELCSSDTSGFYFQGLGLLVQGTDCVIFTPYGDTTTGFVLENYSGFVAGDTVFVEGFIEIPCQTECPEADGCLTGNTIEAAFSEGSPIPGSAIIRFAFDAPVDSLLGNSGVIVLDSIAGRLEYLVAYGDTIPFYEFFQDLLLHPGVLLVEPNFEISVPEIMQMSISFPDEQAPSHVPGSSPAAFYYQDGVSTTRLDSASLVAEGDGVKVAVIDNGFDFDHPLLQNALEDDGYDFLDGDSIPAADTGESFEHGTFVAGLILLGAPGCTITPLRAFDGDGYGNSFAIAQAIYHAIDVGVDIINMSFGMQDPSYLVEQACSDAADAGITLVASAGNDSLPVPVYPAALPEVICVSAIDTVETVADFSNYGEFVDVCAPGVDIYSSLAGYWDWGTWRGTSFATAFVTATCALALSVDSTLDPAEMMSLVRTTARTDLEWGAIETPDMYYGYGCVDAANVVYSLDTTVVVCGDASGDQLIDVDDVVFIVSYVFSGGPAPDPESNGDPDCSGWIDIDDVVYLIEYVFSGGPEPCCP